jgi:hypothetical protein
VRDTPRHEDPRTSPSPDALVSDYNGVLAFNDVQSPIESIMDVKRRPRTPRVNRFHEREVIAGLVCAGLDRVQYIEHPQRLAFVPT